ncbi:MULTISPECIES: AMP-binding protein [unclassified Gordonia (in: high G+C Gram-positive bacteria)]|uniref:AMP-binding protein n=1 Tax=Gordonia TaxID=2053 RepID=UPI00071C652E|nr:MULTISPECIES: AMP-binding protein [unclassified Gordonia (in: high G+C Gram-positive bacteria)]KSU61306.1 AMP-dependent synthetase [Gordonia sp. SGD-V-85]MDT0220837.1 AMP-binding protein [Gordonia sp. AC31]SCB78622.1 acetyl-CoA synthetase [Gordonia sp. v-85]
MASPVDTRVREILATYTGDGVDVAHLLCDRHPTDAVALTFVDADRSIRQATFGELAESSKRVAAVLAARGVGQGSRVATLMGKSPELLAVVLGIWRLGAVYAPLFTAFAEAAVSSRLVDADVTVVIADEDQAHKVPDGTWELVVNTAEASDGSLAALTQAVSAGDVAGQTSVAVGGDGPLVHMFTSGTTGKPKGVVHPVRYAAGWQSYLEFGLGVDTESVFWCGADPGWAYGLYTAIVAPLAAGITTTLTRGGFSPQATWAALDELRVTDYAAAPTVYRGLLTSPDAPPEGLSLKRLSSAGEPLTPEVNEWAQQVLGLQVHDHYGQTELGMPIGYPHHRLLERPIVAGAMGVSLPGWQMTVLRTDTDVAADFGEVGQLAVDVTASDFMTFTAYAGNAEATAKRFRGDGRYFLTGDIATIDSDGVIRFSSRDDDVILMAGYRIGPFDVESVLLTHPAVAECAVIAAPDRVRGEVVEAFVVLASNWTVDGATTESELQQWVKTHYAAHAYPRQVHLVPALPKTPSGKIQRAELRKQRREQTTEGSPS